MMSHAAAASATPTSWVGGLFEPTTIRALSISAVLLGLYYRYRQTPGTYVSKLTVKQSTANATSNGKTSSEGPVTANITETTFIDLLGRMIAHSKSLQNSPLANPPLIPNEDLIADIVIEYLKPYSGADGPLVVEKITYVNGRSNVIITYNSSISQCVSFVGSHMDVVPANPDEWIRDPFKLTIEGDRVYGRGVTDCLGHVAMLTEWFAQLAKARPPLNLRVVAVFIANEESSAALGVGIDELAKRGELDRLKNGPLYWVDSADAGRKGPTLGTGGAAMWTLTATGKLFHSGMPHKAINAITLANEAVRYIQRRFYNDFPQSQREIDYKYEIGSSLKPTQISCPPGSFNQIPRQCTISGDVRFTPFYTIDQIKAKVAEYVAALNTSLIRNNTLPRTGYDTFVLESGGESGEAIQGLIEWQWLGHAMRGVAVDIESNGYKAVCDAIAEVNGSVTPFSLTGSLPIIDTLQDQGFDVQVVGFGRMDAYHALNEYAQVSEFVGGAQVITRIVNKLNANV